MDALIKQCIPLHRHSKQRSIVGWNDEVKHYYGMARSEFKYWKQMEFHVVVLFIEK